MKQQDNHIISDITAYDAEASIYKILFQDKATALLKYIIDKISIDRYENINFTNQYIDYATHLHFAML